MTDRMCEVKPCNEKNKSYATTVKPIMMEISRGVEPQLQRTPVHQMSKEAWSKSSGDVV